MLSFITIVLNLLCNIQASFCPLLKCQPTALLILLDAHLLVQV